MTAREIRRLILKAIEQPADYTHNVFASSDGDVTAWHKPATKQHVEQVLLRIGDLTYRSRNVQNVWCSTELVGDMMPAERFADLAEAINGKSYRAAVETVAEALSAFNLSSTDPPGKDVVHFLELAEESEWEMLRDALHYPDVEILEKAFNPCACLMCSEHDVNDYVTAHGYDAPFPFREFAVATFAFDVISRAAAIQGEQEPELQADHRLD